MQEIKIYQTTDNSSVCSSPILSPSRKETDPDYPWLQPGYYFWEHYIEDARKWGEVRYNNDYSIYSSSYDMDDTKGLDLVSNYRHKDLFFKGRDRLIRQGEKNVTIEKIVKHYIDLMKSENRKIIFTRLASKPFNRALKYNEVKTPNDHVVVFYPTTVQVCFYDFPNILQKEKFKHVEKNQKQKTKNFRNDYFG